MSFVQLFYLRFCRAVSAVTGIVLVMWAIFPVAACADTPPISLENHESPGRNVSTEPLAQTYNYRQAVRFADNAAMDWQHSRRCVTCHTNGMYLIARPAAGVDSPAYRDARSFTKEYLKRYVVDHKEPRGQRGSIEGIVATTAFKAISDIKTTGGLDDITKTALDYIWANQDDSGAWERWLKCHWGPYEVDDHFGVTLVALAMGIASDDDYTRTPNAITGVKKLRSYLQAHPPSSLHQTGMALWASCYLGGLADQATKQRWKEALFAAQKQEGGWVLIELGNDDWQREDQKPQSREVDGYATAFAAHVLIESGVPREDARIAKALQWLKEHQRRSGRWYTRSPRRDGPHFITHAATNFAILALASEE